MANDHCASFKISVKTGGYKLTWRDSKFSSKNWEQVGKVDICSGSDGAGQKVVWSILVLRYNPFGRQCGRNFHPVTPLLSILTKSLCVSEIHMLKL